MNIDRELADEQWRKEWREKNSRALVPEYRRQHNTSRHHDHSMRLEWEITRKKIRDVFGDAFLDGIPLRGEGCHD